MGKITIEKIMNPHLVSVSPATKTKTALKLLEDSNISLIPVISDSRLVGIVKSDDLRGVQEFVKDAMKEPLFVEQGKSVDYAIKYITGHSIDRVPVVDSSIGMRCTGIVSSSDLLKAKKST
jgi:CBS domain-containing protein